MTNSIWHKANEKPELNKYVIVRRHGTAQWRVFKFDNKTMFYEPFTDDLWAYVKEVVATADRAERLQKAVDLAVHSFNEICAGVPSDIWVFDEATKATNEIKHLIKENQ
ncbi:MAG: hypothetical protein J6R99_03970 [Alphaproteobacteria bacterium]|nr:hypothetical protein [Alphaproteobacteria bacterium]